MILNKRLDASSDWNVFHTSLSKNYSLKLNKNIAAFDASAGTNGGGFTVDSTNMTAVAGASTQNNNNANGGQYIAYCFTSISGYSKFGSYAGSGSNNNAVTLGFQPNFVLVKRSNSTGGWPVYDSERSGSNPINDRLEANNDQAEQINSGDKWLNFNSNNFEANGSDSELNASGGTYIYMSFKIN